MRDVRQKLYDLAALICVAKSVSMICVGSFMSLRGHAETKAITTRSIRYSASYYLPMNEIGAALKGV